MSIWWNAVYCPNWLDELDGFVVAHWWGRESALAEADPTTGSPVIWEHPDIAFRQYSMLTLERADGTYWHLHSRMDDGSGGDIFGFYMQELAGWTPEPAAPLDEGEISMSRSLDLLCWPTGRIETVQARRSAQWAVTELQLRIAGRSMRLLAAEVNDQMQIVMDDESILVQIDGGVPDPGVTEFALPQQS